MRDEILRMRNRLIVSSAYARGRAIQLENRCGGRPTVESAWLHWNASWLQLLAIIFGDRPVG